jgi:two-component system cell cycle response regulator DivK
MARILIVEDNEMNRDMLSRRLERAGHEALVAPTAGEGLTMARTHGPDLVLMDLSLPDMDGRDATRQLRAAEETRSLPIIALTAHAMASDRESALAAGCDDFETKPVDFARLSEKIAALVGRVAP